MSDDTGANRRAEQRQKTRTAILQAAKGLFAERGYEKTSMRLVAQRAGVAVGTIFVYFANKLDLLTNTLHQDIDDTLAEAFGSLPASAPIPDKLQHLTTRLFGYYAANPDLARTLLKHSMFEPHPQGKIYEEQVTNFIAAIAAMLEREKEAGRLSKSLDSQQTATTIMAIYLTVLIAGMRQSEVDATAMGAQFRGLVEHLLKTITN